MRDLSRTQLRTVVPMTAEEVLDGIDLEVYNDG